MYIYLGPLYRKKVKPYTQIQIQLHKKETQKSQMRIYIRTTNNSSQINTAKWEISIYKYFVRIDWALYFSVKNQKDVFKMFRKSN